MKAREGDLIQAKDGLIFDVKGLVHPPERIVAFPRFVPDHRGNRKRQGITYKKVYSLSERFKLLEEESPQYLVFDTVFGERLCEVPKGEVKQYFHPTDRLQELRGSSKLDELEVDTLRFTELLQSNSNISWERLGISGSLLVRLHTPQSDIDPVVYGEKNCLQVYDTLKSLTKSKNCVVKTYALDGLKRLYEFRSQDTHMPFDDFLAVERRKVLQGKFRKHDFFVRCIKDWNEVEERYGDVVYENIGYARIRAVVSSDSEAFFTPCRYILDNVEMLEGETREAVTEIVSFRGRFCEQARNGETVVAQGKVEKVQKVHGNTFFRLLLGGRPSDFMMSERGFC